MQLNGCFLPKNVPLSLDCFLVLKTLINQKYPLYLPGNKTYKKIIKKCWKIADLQGVDIRQTYIRVNKKKHSKRAIIEPVIGHLKIDYRLYGNYLNGIGGDTINLLLAAAARNFKRRINLWRTEAIRRWLLICRFIINAYWKFIARNLLPKN